MKTKVVRIMPKKRTVTAANDGIDSAKPMRSRGKFIAVGEDRFFVGYRHVEARERNVL